MPRAVASNSQILQHATDLENYLRASSVLSLFKNDYVPTPVSDFGDFVAADFAGYVPVDMTALWTGLILVVDGEYQFTSSPVSFIPTAGSQTIYGWYLGVGGTVWFSRRFDAPVVVSPDNPLYLVIKPEVFSRSLFPCERS